MAAPPALVAHKPHFHRDSSWKAPARVTTVAQGLPYGDECNTVTLDPAWTLRNIPSVTGDGTKYTIPMDAAGDAMTRAFTDPAADFEIMIHGVDTTFSGGQIGPCALDASGNGVAFGPYGAGSSHLWVITGYAYASTGPAAPAGAFADSWMHLRRVGTSWSARWSNGGLVWSAWSSGLTDARTITQIGVLRPYGSGATTFELGRFVYGTPNIPFHYLPSSYAAGEIVDGVTLVTDDRILLKNQDDPAENGIIRVNATGAPTRDYDMDVDTEVLGTFVYVVEGTLNGGTFWYCTNTALPTLETTPLTFADAGAGASAFTLSVTDGVTTVAPTIAMTFVNATLADLGGGNAEVTLLTGGVPAPLTASDGAGGWELVFTPTGDCIMV